MGVHLLHPQWQTTYCGWGPRNVEMITTTEQYVTCPQCIDAHKLMREIDEAEPHHFSDE